MEFLPVPLTIEDFHRECRMLDELMAQIGRKKPLASLSVDQLVEAFVVVHEPFCQLDRLLFFRASTLEGNRFEGAKKVRERGLRKRLATIDYMWAIKGELVSRGESGTLGIKRLFTMGDSGITLMFAELAAELFPDEAEPVLEALLKSSDEHAMSSEWSTHRYRLQELLTMIRGYRSHRSASIAPTLGHDDAIGLAPALRPSAKTPTDFPALLLGRHAHNLLVDRLDGTDAILDAWRRVVLSERLDPAELERVEVAPFDFRARNPIIKAVMDFYRYDEPLTESTNGFELATRNLAFTRADGSPVARGLIREAMMSAVCGNRECPTWAESAFWRLIG
ncbi:hypothetical protein D3C72_808260 [compost metagenome]